jgi:hypothetical protein
MPPFPGAQYNFVIRGDCRSFHASACSRPPLPITRTFIKEKNKVRVRGKCMSNEKREERTEAP